VTPRPRAIVFDLDGTLADTKHDIAAACNHALASVGRPPLAVDVIAAFVGDGARALVARALGLSIGDPLTADAFATFSSYYAEHSADLSGWMPGARDALDASRDLGLLVALATNKPRSATVPLVAALGMTAYFDAIYAGGDGPLKPDPAAITGALAPMGVSPRDAWVVGDGPQDIRAGAGAGAFTVAVKGGFASESALREAKPHVLLGSLVELPALLRGAVTRTSSA
jgi:phosphoglycolate phosphatase